VESTPLIQSELHQHRRFAAERPNQKWSLHLSMLAIELQGLVDLDFEIELTGFSLAES